jgi:hypothetical protein
MWRIWTRGWGLPAWWRWWTDEGLPIWLAWRLPRRVALWAFIRVYGECQQAPGEEYSTAYDAWVKRSALQGRPGE